MRVASEWRRPIFDVGVFRLHVIPEFEVLTDFEQEQIRDEGIFHFANLFLIRFWITLEPVVCKIRGCKLQDCVTVGF